MTRFPPVRLTLPTIVLALVAANPILKPIGELPPPAVTLEQIGDDQEAAKLLREAGLI